MGHLTFRCWLVLVPKVSPSCRDTSLTGSSWTTLSAATCRDLQSNEDSLLVTSVQHPDKDSANSPSSGLCRLPAATLCCMCFGLSSTSLMPLLSNPKFPHIRDSTCHAMGPLPPLVRPLSSGSHSLRYLLHM